MRYGLKRVSGPDEEPLTSGEAKAHLKVDSDQTADDDLIDDLLKAAREDCEDFTRRCFVSSIWELTLDEFPNDCEQQIKLPRPPLIRVLSVHYVDADGVTRELGSDNFQVDDRHEPARLRPAYGLNWPQTRVQMNAVKVTYLAGYPIDDSGSPTDESANVPKAIVAAIKLQLGHLYKQREAVVVGTSQPLAMGVEHLLMKMRVVDFELSHP